MEKEWKKLLFVFVFRHISMCFYSNSKLEGLLDAKFNSASNEYPPYILFMDPANPKTRNTWKNVMMTSSSHFLRCFLFLGWWGALKVCRVSTRWMQNLISHPMSSPDKNLSKNTGRYVENTNKKTSFFSFLPPKIINIILLF